MSAKEKLKQLKSKYTSFLGTTQGLVGLSLSKILNLCTEIYALHSANKAVDICNCGMKIQSGLFECYLLIFLYQRCLLLPLIYTYGFKPTTQYEQYALQQMSKKDPENNKSVNSTENESYAAPTISAASTNIVTTDKKSNASDSEPLDLQYSEQEPTQPSMNAPRPMEMNAPMDNTEAGLLTDQDDDIIIAEGRKLKAVRTLWYGALFNTSNYISVLWECGQFPQVKCIMCWYLFTWLFLLAMSIGVMIATQIQFDLESMSGLMDQVSGGKADVSFGGFDAFMLFLSLFSTQYGLLQMLLVFGTTMADKLKHQVYCCTGIGATIVRGIFYIVGLGIFILMIVAIVIMIAVMKSVSDFENKYMNVGTDEGFNP